MSRPIRVLFRTGNHDGSWPCDVPCEYLTSEPRVGTIDVVVGEGGPPALTAALRKANPGIATAARSMESAINYPGLKSLPSQVDCPMTTNLRTSVVPVVYLTRSSIKLWGKAPPVWNASALAEHFSQQQSRRDGAKARASTVFIARNCHSRNGREDAIKKLSQLLPGGVDRPGMCLNNVKWPRCDLGKKCGKHATMRRYPFYLALENSDEMDYVSEKVFHALEAGVVPIYAGAPNVADFLPNNSVIELRWFGGSFEKLATYLQSLLDEPARYAEYFAWKRDAGSLSEAFQQRFGFVGTHAKCRLCRWAYSHKYKLKWSQQAQRPLPTSGGVTF